MKGRWLFLGTGSSMGVPQIGCKCSVCQSEDPCNKRLRPSALIQVKKKNLLIDVGPDFRYQALRSTMSHIDGLFLTHCHYDHIAGLDDLRTFNFLQKSTIPCLLSQETFSLLKKRYEYLFSPKEQNGNYSASFTYQILEKEAGKTTFIDLPIQYFSYFQAEEKVTGIRIGDLAYISDIKDFPKNIFQHLQGLNYLILSSVRKKSSRVHFNIEEALLFADQVKAKKTFLTHLSHEIDHEIVQKELPNSVFLAYDGLELTFSIEDNK